MLRVGHHYLEGSFEDGVDRLPIHSRALHGYMSTAFRKQPFAQAHQLSRGGAERSHLLLGFPILENHQQASHDRGLMHIHSTTAFHQSLHDASSAEAIAAPQVCYKHCHASFPFSGCDKTWYLYRRGSVSPAGSVSSQSKCRPPSN